MLGANRLPLVSFDPRISHLLQNFRERDEGNINFKKKSYRLTSLTGFKVYFGTQGPVVKMIAKPFYARFRDVMFTIEIISVEIKWS